MPHSLSPRDEARLDSRARRAARKFGYRITKSRRAPGLGNHGGYMLVDKATGVPVAGWDYDFTVEDVLDFCKEDEPVVRFRLLTGGKRPS